MKPRCTRKGTIAKLINEIQRRWTSENGLIVILKNSDNEEVGRLALQASTTSLFPEHCILWQGETSLYSGAPTVALHEHITKLGCCKAEFTDYKTSGLRFSNDRLCIASNEHSCKSCAATPIC